MFKKVLAAIAVFVCLALVASPASASLPMVDLEIGARYWSASPSGDLSYDGKALDLEDDLDFEREGLPYVYARAHLPFLFLDAHYTRLDYSGDSADFPETEFGDIDLEEYVDISSEADIDLLHGGAMFSLPFPVLDMGLGAGLNYIDAENEIEATNDEVKRDSASAEGVLPVVKGLVRFSPPVVGLSLSLAGEGIAYSGNSFYDVRAQAGYTIQDLLLGDLRLEAGYRSISVDYDEHDLVLDSSFNGPFAGLSLTF